MGQCPVNLLDRLATSPHGEVEPLNAEHLVVQDALHVRVIQTGDTRGAGAEPRHWIEHQEPAARATVLSRKPVIADQGRKT